MSLKDRFLETIEVSEITKVIVKMIVVYGAILLVFQIAYYKENIVSTAKTVTMLMWMFVLPGFFLLDYWKKYFSFHERLIIGTVVGLAASAIAMYWLHVLSVPVWWYPVMVPPSLIVISAIINLFKKDKNEGNEKIEKSQYNNDIAHE